VCLFIVVLCFFSLGYSLVVIVVVVVAAAVV